MRKPGLWFGVVIGLFALFFIVTRCTETSHRETAVDPKFLEPPSNAHPVLPAPQPTSAPPAPLVREAAQPGRPVLHGSRAAFRAWFQKLDLEFESAPLADGTPREMGKGGLLIVETIGFGDALERTSLTFGLAKGDISGLAAATGAMMVFMRETGWEQGHRWVTSTMQRPKGGKTTKNGVHYELTAILPGMYNLSAKPASLTE